MHCKQYFFSCGISSSLCVCFLVRGTFFKLSMQQVWHFLGSCDVFPPIDLHCLLGSFFKFCNKKTTRVNLHIFLCDFFHITNHMIQRRIIKSHNLKHMICYGKNTSQKEHHKKSLCEGGLTVAVLNPALSSLRFVSCPGQPNVTELFCVF